MRTTRRTRTSVLIVFVDLTRFTAQSQRVEDDELASTLDDYYGRIASAVRDAGGTTVKFIGDASLLVFPEAHVNQGVKMLLELKPAVDRFFTERGWECRMNAKVHFGDVMAGDFGPDDDRRFDVIGRAVNTAAVLQSQGITLSVEAFRKLAPELRQEFKKHTPPITYIRLEDARPRR